MQIYEPGFTATLLRFLKFPKELHKPVQKAQHTHTSIQEGFQHPCLFIQSLPMPPVSLLVHGHPINKFWHNINPADAAEDTSVGFDSVVLPVSVKQKYFGH